MVRKAQVGVLDSMKTNYYDQIAKYYNKIYGHERFYRRAFLFVDRFRKKHGLPKKVLDIACGTGLQLRYFDQAGYETYGFDLSEGMLSVAKKDLPKTHLRKGSFDSVQFDCKFPLIISTYNSLGYCSSKQVLTSTQSR